MKVIDESNKLEFIRTHKGIILIEYDGVLTNKDWTYKRLKPNLGCSELLHRIKNENYTIVVTTVRSIDESLFNFLRDNEYYTYIDGVTNLILPHVAFISSRAIRATEDYGKTWRTLQELNG